MRIAAAQTHPAWLDPARTTSIVADWIGRAAADDVRKAYDPFMADSQEIVKALSIDTSSAAVPGLKPVMSRAAANGKTLKDKLGVLRAELNKLQTGAK